MRSADVVHCAVADGLSLSLRRLDTMRIEYGIIRPYHSVNPQNPDVAVMMDNRFRFFWSDSLSPAGGPKLYRFDAAVTDSGMTIGDTVSVSGKQALLQRPGYLHANMVDTNFFVSVVEKNLFRGYGNRPTARLDSIGGGALSIFDASHCFFKGNLFLAIYEVSSAKIVCRKIAVGPLGIPSQSVQDYPVADNQQFCFNPSIAADSSGNILALWIQGTKASAKRLSWAYYDSTFTIHDSSTLADPIDDVNMLNHYDEARVVSYGRGKFACVNWDAGGVMLRRFEIRPALPLDTMAIDTVRVTSRTGSRFPSLSANNRSLSIFWIDGVAPSDVSVKGIRYPLTAGTIDIARQETILDLPINKTVESTDTIVLNCAMDSSGNIGVCWNMNHRASVGVLSARDLFHDSGSWTSLPTPIRPGLVDSVYFDSLSITADFLPAGASVHGFLKVGRDSIAAIGAIPLETGADLKTGTKGLYSYFQYAISLTASANLLQSPAIAKVSLHWNAKPRFDTLGMTTVNGIAVDAVDFGDTLVCRSRCDSVTCAFSVYDADSGDCMYSDVSWLSRERNDTLVMSRRSSSVVIGPIVKSDTVVTCQFSAHDKAGWAAQDGVLSIQTRNCPPFLRVRAVHSASPIDTLDIISTMAVNVQQSDSIEFIYSLHDSNDPGIVAFLSMNSVRIDSTSQGIEKHFLFRGSAGRPQGDEFNFSASDPDTSSVKRIVCGVNHYPRIDSVTVNGRMVHDNDTLRTILNSASVVVVHADDPDVGYWDTVTFQFRRSSGSIDSKDSSFSFVPGQFDTAITIVVRDLFDKRDTVRLYCLFPWYEKDSLKNPGLSSARTRLATGLSQIVGSNSRDTVAVPLNNTGSDTLSISSLRLTGDSRTWMKVLAVSGDSGHLVDPFLPGTVLPLKCLPDSAVELRVLIMSDNLRGDGLVYDTLLIGTNDGHLRFDTLPVRLEYNDLPRITGCSVSFTKDKPYWLAKRKRQTSGAMQAYVFPPFASISISFSEPMDSASATIGMRIYSVFDSAASGGGVSLPLSQQWTQAKTKVDVSPRYASLSPHFGFQPPFGFFIPTDSIRLVVSSAVTDIAPTPSGPNGLDVHRLAKRTAFSDTAFSFRIDSVSFALSSVSPDSADVGADPSAPIQLTFSSTPFPGTIDTGRINNRMLVVHSSYGGASAVDFSRISANGAAITLVPSKRFFYGDTVRCRYHGIWARDSLGYSVDVNRNGIPLSMFDSASSQDDKEWFFVVKDIKQGAIFPADKEVDVASKTPIRISFSDTIDAVAVDTSHHANRTLIVSSRFSGGGPIDFDSVKLAGATATFYPVHRFYYGDSVFCSYRGLSTFDTAAYAINGGKAGPVFTNDTIQWSFSIRPIRLVSVTPESSLSSSSIHPEIAMQFSEPVYAGTFDSDTSNRNRSFQLTSSFSGDSALSFAAINFSTDSTRVVLRPKATFFSNDSVNCTFIGFLRNISYTSGLNLPVAGNTDGASEWYFRIRNEQFYTYPNPYKPGVDPRHCSSNGPCGIWFKNLHVLKNGVSEVMIKVFSISSHPLYSTQAAGVRIRFQTGNPELRPEWKWDTRNQRGELIASGLYLYAIYDVTGKVLLTGKLMIVR